MLDPETSLWESIQCPGLTPAARDVAQLVEQLRKRWAVFSYKQDRSFLWVLFIGGTGTGKSTLFNALCEEALSETGLERPKTSGPVAYVHQHTLVEKDFPLQPMRIRRLAFEKSVSKSHAGVPGELLVLEHLREGLSHLALVDMPDLDSLEIANREMVEDLYLLSDVIVFVTSQEKYADEVPFQFLARIHRQAKPCFLLLNKANGRSTANDILETLHSQGVEVPHGMFWILPYFASDPSVRLADDPMFRNFRHTFLQKLDRTRMALHFQEERKRSSRELAQQIQVLLDLLGREKDEAQKWLEHLDIFFRVVCQKLFEMQEKRFGEESREYLQREIRRLYNKYDLLGTPRRFISQIILTPLSLFGFRT
ncbi:MAG: hypothetical protein EHM36_07650, partial [Deltaproteobacteria bacterium]